jgi:hypothetical protein
MPSQRGDALCHRLHHLHAGGTARRREIKADAANARGVEPPEFAVGDARIDDRDAAGAAFVQHFDQAIIEDAVGRRLDDHVARGADPLLQQPIVGDRGIAWTQPRVRVDLEARAVDVVMAIRRLRRSLPAPFRSTTAPAAHAPALSRRWPPMRRSWPKPLFDPKSSLTSLPAFLNVLTCAPR